jgi:endogenous inhibitor of DNA gyrase (YacG/DUF329 family)
MTSPAERITVRCPFCGRRYSDWHRASVNLTLDPELDDPAYLEEAATATCPACGYKVELGCLIVRGDTWVVR